jgi:hypothetical protein
MRNDWTDAARDSSLHYKRDACGRRIYVGNRQYRLTIKQTGQRLLG